MHDHEHPLLEDVYWMLRSQQATLLVGHVNEQFVGCVVVVRKLSPWSSDVTWLHVWLCYNTAGHNILKLGQVELEKLARATGAKRLTLRAPALAFERLTADLGYTLSEIELSKDL